MSRRSDMGVGAQGERVMAGQGLAEPSGTVGALRDAAFTGLITFGLLLPLIGFKTDVNGSNQLILATRWPLLFTLVAVTVAGRFLYAFAITPWLARRAQPPAAAAPPARRE